jgi:hypothetical protein
MIKPAFTLLLAAITAAGPTGLRSDAIVIGLANARSAERAGTGMHAGIRRGIDFGVLEMTQTANLLGREVRIAEGLEPPYGWIVIGDQRPQSGAPVIYVTRPPESAGPCDFSIGLTDMPADEVLWHPTLDRFGASELNERYLRRYEEGMTSEAWAGWTAVKALVESALRRRPDENPCAALARLRFDGHKGRPLHFDAASRVLSQPTYVVKDGRVTGVRK